jgi:hypothetical protein
MAEGVSRTSSALVRRGTTSSSHAHGKPDLLRRDRHIPRVPRDDGAMVETIAGTSTQWAWAKRLTVYLLAMALAADAIAFRHGYFEHPVDHDYGMPTMSPGTDAAMRNALVLIAALLIVRLWPRLVGRYRRVWT